MRCSTVEYTTGHVSGLDASGGIRIESSGFRISQAVSADLAVSIQERDCGFPAWQARVLGKVDRAHATAA
jgi:hypothetical protein